jgi:DNA-directed RNA polymerase alpha subunit
MTKKESKSMKNGARYVVTTHWGTFSLDEGSYQDYLTGRLWICWTPGKPEQQIAPSDHLPINITDRAVNLRDQADKIGVLETLRQLGIHETIIPYSKRIAELSIDEMNLTVRSSNGLKRASIHTFGQLKERLEIENGLINIRNIGQKSLKEIKQLFFEECYTRLLPYEKAQYWQEVLDKR